MKKIISLLFVCAASLACFAQDTTPEMLKKKELFSKTELFDHVGIYSDAQANANLIKEYEADPASFKDDQLMPVVMCYMAYRENEKAKDLLSRYVAAVPTNTVTLRMLGTMNLLAGEGQKALESFKKAHSLGDKGAVKPIATAYFMLQTPDEIAAYFPEIKELAKTDMEALNLALLYALRNPKEHDNALIKELLSACDNEKIMASATNDALATILRVYVAKSDIWPDSSVAIPARAASLAEVWHVSKAAYEKALKANPNDTFALKGYAIVEYRTGDPMKAAQLTKKAFELGDKEALNEGMMLFIRTGNQKIYDMFKASLSGANLIPFVRANMVQYAVNAGDKMDVFYAACIGEGSELLYKDAYVRDLITEGLRKYPIHADAAKVRQLWEANMPVENASATGSQATQIK